MVGAAIASVNRVGDGLCGHRRPNSFCARGILVLGGFRKTKPWKPIGQSIKGWHLSHETSETQHRAANSGGVSRSLRVSSHDVAQALKKIVEVPLHRFSVLSRDRRVEKLRPLTQNFCSAGERVSGRTIGYELTCRDQDAKALQAYSFLPHHRVSS